MTTTKKAPGRGRPRAFDLDEAVEVAQALFHEQGYGGVGVAALTKALGINPPSFYAAFGSKAALFDRVLARYAACALPIDALLREGRAPAEALGELLDVAARTYTAEPAATGCLVLESARTSADPDSAARARAFKEASRERVRRFVMERHPARADAVADYMVSTMSGLSAGAREGWSAERLLQVAALAKAGIDAMLAEGHRAPSHAPSAPR